MRTDCNGPSVGQQRPTQKFHSLPGKKNAGSLEQSDSHGSGVRFSPYIFYKYINMLKVESTEFPETAYINNQVL